MNHIKILLLLCVVGWIVHCQDCTPFGVRIFLGGYHFNSSSPQIMRVKFNTNDLCQYSFLYANQSGVTTTFFCDSNVVTIVNQTVFNTYIHTCSVNEFNVYDDLTYGVYGSDEQGNTTLFEDRFITVNLIDPQRDYSNQFIVLADWGEIITKPLIPLNDSFTELIQNNRSAIHGILINGDVAYDMESNECQNYVDFLNMLSQIATVWPLIFTAGNHQHISTNNYRLYTSSFELYNLSTSYHQPYTFKNFAFLALDTYYQFYGKSNATFNQVFLAGITNELANIQNAGLWSVAGAHYPLYCTNLSEFACANDLTIFKDIFSTLNNYGANMYLGAHIHTYERQYPYYNQTFALGSDTPYNNLQGMVSIVDGAAGNDRDFVDTQYNKSVNTVVNSYNQTGFGILHVESSTFMEYTHYSTTGGLHVYDNVQLTRTSATQKQGMLEKVTKWLKIQ